MQRFVFDNETDFSRKLAELVSGGVAREKIRTVTPYPVHEAEEILSVKGSPVRYFALVGALTGLSAGFAFTIYTVKAWPLMSGGKPIVSIPAFLIIAFALTILFGALFSFFGFLVTARLPGAGRIVSTDDCTNEFEILADVEHE
jgi:hypothetical protein